MTEKTQLNDLLSALDDNNLQNEAQKDLKPVFGKESKIKKIGRALEQHEKDEIEQKMGRKQILNEMNEYTTIVKRNAIQDTQIFPAPKPTEMKKVEDLYVNSELNQQINEIVKGLNIEKTIQNEEKQIRRKMSMEEQVKRSQELSKLRGLMFYDEIKARRQNKIKSKKYHRILKREKEKEKKKEIELMLEEDPEAAMEYNKQQEMKRIRERMTQRHTTSQWSKEMKQKKLTKIEDVRAAMNEKDKIGKELSEKMKKDDIFDEKLLFGGSQLDRNIQEMLGHVMDEEDDENELDDETIKMKAQQRINQLDQLAGMDNNITKMKFMQRMFAAEKEEMKDIIDDKNMEEEIDDKEEVLIEMNDVVNMNNEEGEIEMNENGNVTIKTKKNTNPILKTSQNQVNEMKSEKQKIKVPSKLDQLVNEVMKTANEEKNNEDMSDDEDESEENNDQNEIEMNENSESEEMEIIEEKEDEEKENKEREIEEIQLTKNENVNEILQIQQETKMDEENTFKEDQKEILRMAFADDDVLNEINEIDEEQRKMKEEQSTRMAGWGSWTGEGIEEKKRKEAKPKKVVFNKTYDKKFTKYTLSDVPAGFENEKEYRKALEQPLGKEWASLLTHEKLNQPELIIRRGKNIEPLEKIRRKNDK